MTMTKIEKLNAWLKENVVHYPTPHQITMSEFELDWSTLDGSFKLSLDDIDIAERPGISLEITGWMGFGMPAFQVPFSLPLSYSLHDFTSETENAIEHGLHQLLPRLYGVGPHPITREWVTINAPISERIPDIVQFEIARKKIDVEGFRIVVPL